MEDRREGQRGKGIPRRGTSMCKRTEVIHRMWRENVGTCIHIHFLKGFYFYFFMAASGS